METTEEKNNKLKIPTTPVVLDQLKFHFFHPGGFGKHLTELGFDLSKLKQVSKETMKESEKILVKISEDLEKLQSQENVVNIKMTITKLLKCQMSFISLYHIFLLINNLS